MAGSTLALVLCITNPLTPWFSTCSAALQSSRTDIRTDMGYNMYGPGIYDAITFWAPLNLPIYITETGCADANDNFRDKFIDSYFNNVVRAAHDG